MIRSHYGHGFIKQCVRDHLLLRTEPATNNVNDYAVNKAIEHLPVLRQKLSSIVDNYLNVQQNILETFVHRAQLHQLTQPALLPKGKRVPGWKLDHPRQLALMHALLRFSHIAAGNTFTTADLHPQTAQALGCSTSSTLSLPCATIGSNCAPKVSSKNSLTPAVIVSSAMAIASACCL